MKQEKKFLFVDDDALVRMVLEGVCEQYIKNFKILESGVQALEALKNDTFNIIISDLNMPAMNGYELVQKIKSDKKLNDKNYLIYALSANFDQGIKEKIKKAGFDGFLIKGNAQALADFMNEHKF